MVNQRTVARESVRTRDEMAGSVILGQATILREVLGDGVYQAALTRMPEHLAQELREATSVSWLDVQVFVAMYDAGAAASGRNVVDLHHQVARISLERLLNGLWRVLLRLVGDEQLLKRTPIIFAKGYNQGRLEMTMVGKGQASFRVIGWDAMPQICRRGLRIAIQIALEMGGRKPVEVTLDPRSVDAKYSAKWG